jgi:CBS domain-containing protein
MKAKDVMTPRVVTIKPDATIMQAARLMLQKKINQPVPSPGRREIRAPHCGPTEGV